MKVLLILYLFIAFSSLAFAQENGDTYLEGKETSDHLWPIDMEYGKLYFGAEKIIDKVLAKKGEYLALEVIIHPSFEQLKRITVLKKEGHEQAQLLLTYATNNKGQKLNNKDVKTLRKEISAESLKIMNYVFEETLIETKYSVNNKHISGNDGTIYHFFVNGDKYGNMFGQTWSPRKGILPRVLVDLSEYLVTFLSNDVSLEELNSRLSGFKKKLEVIKNK